MTNLLLTTGFFMYVRELKMQMKNPDTALQIFCPMSRTIWVLLKKQTKKNKSTIDSDLYKVIQVVIDSSRCSLIVQHKPTLFCIRQDGKMAITPVHDLNPECTSTNPELVVIFFHGIGYGENDEWKEAWTSTTSDSKRVCWPQEWLPADLATQNVNNVRILSLSYDSALLGANEDVTGIGKNLVQSLVSKSEYEPLWEAPIVLVGYSFGGLVVKSLIVEADWRAKARIVNRLDVGAQRSCAKFLENLKGTIFYGVPHTGGGENLKQYFVYESQRFNNAKGVRFAKSGILKNIEGFNRQMAALSVDFENAVEQTLIIYAFAEGQPLKRGEPVLVPFASAQQLARRNHYLVEDANHLTICKPSSQNAMNYSLLKDVLAVVMKGTQRQTTPQNTHAPNQQITHPPSQLGVLDPPSEISSSSNETPELEDLR